MELIIGFVREDGYLRNRKEHPPAHEHHVDVRTGVGVVRGWLQFYYCAAILADAGHWLADLEIYLCAEKESN